MRKTALDHSNGAFQRYPDRCNQKMHMVRHNDKRMQPIEAFMPIVLQRLYE